MSGIFSGEDTMGIAPTGSVRDDADIAGLGRPGSSVAGEVRDDRGAAGFRRPVSGVGAGAAARGAGVDEGRVGAVEREDVEPNVLAGRNRAVHDRRKYRYDVVRGRGAGLAFEVTRDAIMSADDAGEALHRLHVKMGVDRENEDVLAAFDAALWFCHTVNGGSVLAPGRSKFSVPGVTKQFDYGDVRDILGVDLRRFFRAYADDITDVNRRVIRDYDPAHPVCQEQWAWLQEIAHNRGLSRYPHLAHDSADACMRISTVERQALIQSKALTVGATPNAADRMKPTDSVVSADRYDSSVGKQY